MKNVLALDIGTKTGFSIAHGNEIIKSGTKNFKQSKDAHIGRRFSSFRHWLISIIQKYDIGQIVFEQVYAHAGVEAAHIYGGFLYHIAAVCDEYGINMNGIGVGTIKKHISGNGRASKQEMIAAVSGCGFHPIDDNEADAIAIMLCYIM